MINPRVQEVIDQVGTDVSGKWVSVENVQEIVNIIMEKAIAELTNKD